MKDWSQRLKYLAKMVEDNRTTMSVIPVMMSTGSNTFFGKFGNV